VGHIRLYTLSRWGIYDYIHCIGGVDKNKLCIDGGSAGGYTTLACLAFKDVFKAGQL